MILKIFRSSSMVERLPVKEMVVGSSPTCGAKEDNTNSFFEDESTNQIRQPDGRSANTFRTS